MKNNVMRTVALALLIYSLVGLAGSLRSLEQAQRRLDAAAEELSTLQCVNAALQKKIESAFTDKAVEAVARERLALVMPGEKIFIFTADGE